MGGGGVGRRRGLAPAVARGGYPEERLTFGSGGGLGEAISRSENQGRKPGGHTKKNLYEA